jgi:hypothetical protein
LKEVAVGAMKESIHLVFEYCAIDLATLIDRMYVGNNFKLFTFKKIAHLKKMR